MQDINESIRQSIRELTRKQESDNILKEFEIYDLYYNRRLYETESVNKNDWDEVKDLLGQMGRVTASLIKKLVSMGKRSAVELCIKAGRNIYKKYKDNGEAIRYIFYTLLFFLVGYTGNTIMDRYNENPVVPGTHIEYSMEAGVDTMRVTNSRGGVFEVRQTEPDKAPVIVSVRKSSTVKETPEKKANQANEEDDHMSPIRLLSGNEKTPGTYHASKEILRAVAEVEHFVPFIYDAKVGATPVRKQDMLDMKKDLTIGFGHKLTVDERKKMAFNTRWSKEKAFEVFKKDAAETERLINHYLKKLPYYNNVEFSQGFFDSVFSWIYSCGIGNAVGTPTREQSEFWRRLRNCRIDREHNCVDKADVYFTISQLRHSSITKRGNIARRNAECLIGQQLGKNVNPKLYNLKG